jgi:hypothetical protein
MKVIQKYRKLIAAFLFILFCTQTLMPNTVYALTSGPEQPEMKGFEPIGNSDMVDLFSGDFSYNIPLMDVGGYPVNLAYHSGASMDDEASWVGYGWGLNVGSLNRNLRGVPDDFNGTDQVERELNIKDHKTYGGKFSMTLDLLGIPVNKYKGKAKKRNLDLNLTLSIGVKYDNYRGIGMELGVNPGLSLTDYVAEPNNKTPEEGDSLLKRQFTDLAGIDLSLSSFGGAGININSKMISKKLIQEDKSSYTQSIGFGYNTRGGGASLTLGLFKSPMAKYNDKKDLRSPFVNGMGTSHIDFAGDTYIPTIDHASKNNSYNFSLHLGPELWVTLLGMGVSGFYSEQKVDKYRKAPAYGFLNSDKAKDIGDPIVDFNREKDIPYSNKVKYLPIPVPTYDMFMANSQDGGGQYRLYRGSSGIFFDPKTKTTSDNLSLGIEIGGGAYWDVGADIYKQDINTTSKKWTRRNDYLSKGDYQGTTSTTPLYEPAYFKRVGEPVPFDKDYVSKLKNTSPVAVHLKTNISDVLEGAAASDKLRTKTSEGEQTTILKRDKREVRNTTFSYLTAKEASNHALDKTLNDYDPDFVVISGCSGGGIRNTFSRTGGYRKRHHLSEITITGDDGKRSIYGIPVYNIKQEEASFSVTPNLSLRKKGLINYSSQDNSTSNTKGRENYYSKEKTPAYATSYLLSAILSPDYVDRTGNGITDDDFGTAVKFNYTLHSTSYKWRTPFAFGADTANYNEGFISDALDDKANYVYGEKETWYLHSIESKTMIAHFITEDRLDGLGVKNNHGEVDTLLKLKRLKEIRLYSKSDLRINGNDLSKTIPIKVVHFVYDYSLCKGLPNNINMYRPSGNLDSSGKLTLKRIYFTFGLNQKGKLNPYDFSYDTTYNFYGYRQYDRWGSFKDALNNPEDLNNSEFPYTLQDTMTNKFVSAWQLNKIILPSGGSINIKYESDDYAFVQDRRASEMCMLYGIGDTARNYGLIDADYIFVKLPKPITLIGTEAAKNKDMRERYFEGITNLYYKFYLDLDGKGHSEFVPGYAELDPNEKPVLVTGTDSIAKIKLKKFKKIINPIAKDGWQFIRTNLPKYAYPGSENLESNQSNLRKAIEALVTAFGTIKELFQGFDKRARNKKYSDKVDLNKSWVRLCSPEWKKMGGGSRVKRIDISDDWETMSGATGAQTSVYSQVYDYIRQDAKKGTISSGVASYEPMLGNDENPFRQPVRYSQNEFLGLHNYYYIEEPFGESFFPGPSVGYSKVTVKTIGSGDAETVNRTGTVVSEFYTAKDYPTKIDILGLEHRKPIPDKIFKLIGGVAYETVGLAQGYSVETNDMHGKPKSVQVYNKSSQKISSVEYFYKSKNELAARKELKNDVKIIKSDGTISDGMIGMDVEMFTDMREQTTENLGVSVKISGGAGAFLIFPFPFFFPGIGVNYDKRNFRSSSTIKIINRFAIQYKTVKMENGSTITSENLLWDAETGNVLLTKTQNEFDDPIYSFAYPAHWKYDGMAQAYKNLGTVLNSFSTNSSGEISPLSVYNSLLEPGDELIDINSGNKYWIIFTHIGTTFRKRLINENGELQQVTSLTLKLLRSGRRNMANTAIATIVSLNNPIVGDKLNITQLTKVLDAKATVFDERWSVPVMNASGLINVSSCDVQDSCMQKFIRALMVVQTKDYGSQFYSTATSPALTVEDVISPYPGNSCLNSFLNGDSASQINFYQYHVTGAWPNATISSGDSAQLGSCKLHFDSVTSRFNYLANRFFVIDSLINGEYLPACQWSKPVKVIPVSSSTGCAYAVIEEVPPLGSFSDCYSTDTIMKFHLNCPPAPEYACIDPVNGIINPYYAGILGNWRPKSSYVYQVKRENLSLDPAKFGGTNVHKSGAYSLFNPFWKYDYPDKEQWAQINVDTYNEQPYIDSKWIAANEMTYFNSKGLEVENKDALNRYSSALFGYLESMPIVVASNSRYREIAYDGFEDYGFTLDCSSSDTCNTGHFNFRKNLNGNTIDTTKLYSHSGKYSLKLDGNATILKTVYSGSEASPYDTDNMGRYVLTSNELSKGFSPIPSKKYVLSFWVKDGSPRDATTSVQATVNGTNLLNTSLTWPVVEGWKRIETQFVLSSVATSFSLQLQSNSIVYIDDIRIHPFNGQMKSFAYDASSQRLWAELDENNFGTFYEYDDEGILVRVKKETERGIMTIKETRSSYRKRQ